MTTRMKFARQERFHLEIRDNAGKVYFVSVVGYDEEHVRECMLPHLGHHVLLRVLESTTWGDPLYPADSTLPDGARGWTMVQPGLGGESTWLEPQDCERATADMREVEAAAKALRTREQALAMCSQLGVGFPDVTVRGMRVQYQNAAYRRLWPCRRAS